MKNRTENLKTAGADKPAAGISLDLDNQWSYMKIHGDQGWEKFPTYLPVFIPLVLEMLKKTDLKITFFVVGQDAALEKNKEFISMLVKEGHELGNHSFNHESWLHLYSKEKIRSEILNAEENIFDAAGVRTRGFRGPGFSWSRNLLEVLSDLNYEYDASTLPTFIGPLARFYYFRTTKLSEEERKERKKLFGSFRDGFMPVKPHFIKVNDDKKILELPVTTVPLVKIPFHLSYLIYLYNISPFIMRQYLQTAINLCRLTKTTPSFLLHPLDLISGDLVPELKFFPGMNTGSETKKNIFLEVINRLSRNFRLLKMSEYAASITNIPLHE